MGVPYSVFQCTVARLEALIAAAGGGGVTFTTSAELAALLSDETGAAGFAVFSTGPTIDAPKVVNGIVDSAGNKVLDFAQVGSAVNSLQVINSATGNGPTLTVQGLDGNIDLNLAGLGTGDVKVATAAPGTNTTQVANTAFVTAAITANATPLGVTLALISGNYLN